MGDACWLNEDCNRGYHNTGPCRFPESLSQENAELREVDRRALRAAVAALLKAADKADEFMSGSQPHVHTSTIRHWLAPWSAPEGGEKP